MVDTNETPVDAKADAVAEIVEPLTAKCPSKWILGLAAISIGTYFYVQKSQIEDLTQQLAHQTEINGTLTKNADTYVKTIDDQNHAIQAANEYAKSIEQEKSDLDSQLAQQRIALDKKVQAILKANKPKTCEESLKYIRQNAEQLKWKN